MFAPISIVVAQAFNDWFTPDLVQRLPLGIELDAVDPFWGGGRFIYIQAGEAITKGNLIQWNGSYSGIDLPSTAGLGRPFGIAMNAMAINTFGWLQLQGRVVASSSADVAADAVAGIGTAGNVGANSAGKQLLGWRSTHANAATVAKTNVSTTANSPVLVTSGYDGWFVGMALSGTGIPASTVVAKLDPDGRTVYTGSAVGTVGDKNSTATGSVTVTGTYTGFVGAIVNNPFAQGAIT